jgi:hypothetical protein
MPTAPVAALSLVAGFAVADATGVRPLGGLVLVGAAAWCATRWRRQVGLPAAAGLVALYAGAFALSHPLGGVIGAWPSVITVSAVTGAIVWAVADAPRVARAAG